jgi:tagatose 6-phosphate kinase
VILAVALNPALDVTYFVERVEWHAGNRVRRVHEQAGGKALNVARVLRTLGFEVVVTGLAGPGLAGTEAFVEIAAATRRTVTVVDSSAGDATGFWEPGPSVSAAEWSSFSREFARLAGEADAVVLAGSLPPGVPDDAYARLAASGVPVVLDADGPALLHGLAARPAIVKPNAAELSRAGGDAAALLAAGAESVVVSHGPEGLEALTPEGAWRAHPPEPVSGNPTGAGDATVAALTAGLVTGQPWPDRLRHAVALSAATVHAAVAGEYDADAYRRYLAAATAERIEA